MRSRTIESRKPAIWRRAGRCSSVNRRTAYPVELGPRKDRTCMSPGRSRVLVQLSYGKILIYCVQSHRQASMNVRHSSAARIAPAVARNRDPILAVLRRVLPAQGTVREIGRETGEHAAYFATHLPNLTWQPSDMEPSALASIAAHRTSAGAANLLE